MTETEVRSQGGFPACASKRIIGKNAASGKSDRRPHRPSNEPQLSCPGCGSSFLWNDGTREYADGSIVQRKMCRKCGLRFACRNKSQLVDGVSTKMLKGDLGIPSDRQLCVALARGAKKLDAASHEGSAARVNPEEQSADVKGRIANMLVSFACYMEKQGYRPETTRGNAGALRALLSRNADVLSPESVKEVLATEAKKAENGEKAWGSNRRRNIINAYTLFLRVNGLSWEKPRCNVVRKIPFIPTEQEIDELVAGCPTKVATLLQLLKETAMRSGEAKRLKWIDLDFQRRTITLNEPEKNSLPRIWGNLNSKVLGMLNALPRTSERIFGDCTLNSLKATYTRARRRLAVKLQNPRLLQVHFHTLRHWKATMEYHYTKDPFHVMNFLGHKRMDNTALYVQLDQKLFKDLPDNSFTMRVAHNAEEATKLGEVGFEPFDVVDGVRLYRKRK